uniref:Transmembrane protein n=1 Tax=Steinernema glaseri TaxID=37863 RepID=A0A1I7YZ35_9BILA
MRGPVQSSLALQLLLSINKSISVLFFLVVSLVYVFKVYTLPYSKYVAITDAWLIALFAPIEACRISWAQRGNKTETPGFLSFSLLLSFAVIALCVYLAAFQSYVLLLEFIFICIEGGLVILESVISLAAMATFSR